MAKQFGGIFAPPITKEKLDKYKLLAATAQPPIVKEWMEKLITMVEVFQQTPDSPQPGTPHPSGRGVIVPLEKKEIDRIWDHVPWKEELDLISEIFDKLPTGTRPGPRIKVPLTPTAEKPDNHYLKDTTEVVDQRAKELRDAAFHLRWYAGQLFLDREPLTNDKL